MPYPLEANPHRHYYASRTGSILGIVLHVTAGAEDTNMIGTDGSAESVVRYGQTVERAASWHGIADSDTIIDCLPDSYTAFHVQGYNSRTLGLEIANRDATWTGKPANWTAATLRNSAAWCAPRVRRYGLPVRLSTRAQVDDATAAGRPFGFTFHSWLDPARRRDPGADFPWRQFASYITNDTDAPEDDDMPYSERDLKRIIAETLRENIGDTAATDDGSWWRQGIDPVLRRQIVAGMTETLRSEGVSGAGDLGRLVAALAPLLSDTDAGLSETDVQRVANALGKLSAAEIAGHLRITAQDPA